MIPPITVPVVPPIPAPSNAPVADPTKADFFLDGIAMKNTG